MKKVISVFLICLLFIFQCSFAADNAAIINNSISNPIKISDAKLERVSSNRVIGSITTTNTTDFYLSDIFFILSIRKFSDEDGKYSEIVKTYEPLKKDFLPKENRELVFSLDLTDKLPEGKYSIFLEINTNNYIIFQPVYIMSLPINGSGEYILTPNGAYSKSFYYKKAGDALTGPSYEKNVSPTAIVKLNSNSDEKVTLFPKATVYKRSIPFESEPFAIVDLESVTFKPNESKTVKISLPKFSEPESYLVKVVFVDEKGEQVSYEYYFRYVVKGDGSKVFKLRPSYNETSNTLDILFSCINSPDSSSLKNFSMNYMVYKGDELVLDKENKIDSLQGEHIINESIPFESDTSYKIKASVVKDSKILDEYEIYVPENINIERNNVYFIDTVDTKFEESARILAGLGFLTGYPDSTFKPNKDITRAEMVVLASKLLDEIAISNYKSTSTSFLDTESHWAHDFIEFAYENGIVNGYPSGKFLPNNKVTYEEALTMLLNTIGYRDNVLKLSTTWPKNYIETGYRLNIIDKLDDKIYSVPAIRGDISDMMLKALMRKEN